MAGMTIPVITKRQFDLPATVSATTPIVLARWVDITHYTEITLVGKLHLDSAGTGSSIDILAKAIAPTEEDPGTDFIGAWPLGTVTFSYNEGVKMRMASLGSNVGSHVQVHLTGTKGSGACTFTISAELVCKE